MPAQVLGLSLQSSTGPQRVWIRRYRECQSRSLWPSLDGIIAARAGRTARQARVEVECVDGDHDADVPGRREGDVGEDALQAAGLLEDERPVARGLHRQSYLDTYKGAFDRLDLNRIMPAANRLDPLLDLPSPEG